MIYHIPIHLACGRLNRKMWIVMLSTKIIVQTFKYVCTYININLEKILVNFYLPLFWKFQFFLTLGPSKSITNWRLRIWTTNPIMSILLSGLGPNLFIQSLFLSTASLIHCMSRGWLHWKVWTLFIPYIKY